MSKKIEKEFMDEIDCNFPYCDKEKCLKLIDKAIAISSGAVYSVVYELCNVPFSEKEQVSSSYLLELLEVTNKIFSHPIKDLIFNVAGRVIQDETLSAGECISLMESIRRFPKEYEALNILWACCYDEQGQMETVYEDIVNEWSKD
jgi:hypothetical protein